jgi:hypothetical protein
VLHAVRRQDLLTVEQSSWSLCTSGCSCQTMGAAGNGKTLYICEGWNGTVWLIIA